MSSLEWTKLRYTITTQKGVERTILNDISGKLKPKKLTCIVGPSGSGKTSLLNILSGRIVTKKKAVISGEVFLDDAAIRPADERELFAYVMQEDALFPTSTPYESIMLAAMLRKIKEPEEAVQRVLKTLGLEKCANTYCGSPMIRGISGGEKKRTCIGVEIVSGPKLLFLDEPTSGLDSFAAYNCVNTLKELVSEGNTVAVVIHQPSSEIFYLFDNAIFMCQGGILYQGPVADVAEWFTEMGYPNPPNYNVCDHVTFLMQTLSKDAIATLRNSSTKKQSTIVNEGQPGTDTENPSDMVKMKPGHEEYKFSRKSSFCVQLKHLFLREVRDVYRDKGTLIARLALVVFLNVLIGLIFRDAGDNTLAAYTPEAHFG
eukprot:GEMP01019733.1.p1 GENE.GEMP01019733.1~~GEMP01019733.1.p1  ORF type:complete len:373 (+),score=75.27 GEMP01019733.1:115-1233(+)